MSFVIEKDWTTKTGLRAIAVVVRNNYRCGYVGVAEGHPFYGVEYSDTVDQVSQAAVNEMTIGKKSPILALTATVGGDDDQVRRSLDVAVDVHGGLTFSGGGDYPAPGLWWFGFDCAHDGDGFMDESYRMFSSDDRVRSLEYVEAECESMAEQLQKLAGVQ